MKKECSCSPNTFETSGGKEFNPAIDQPFEVVIADFEHDALMEYVPLGVAMLKMATLLEAIDWHLYKTGEVSVEEARKRIKWASKLMDKKFDVEYKRLPR